MNKYLILIFLLFVSSLFGASGIKANAAKVSSRQIKSGSYLYYLPRSGGVKLMVVCHGTFAKGKTAKEAAKATIRHWLNFAEKHKVFLIAPIFDNKNFAATKPGALGGYRTLTGRKIGADQFLHQIIVDVRSEIDILPENFYLFGHSAGGQFANRYLARHPQRVLGAVFSAPAWFAFPDPNERWPYGMRPRKGSFKWGDTEERIKVEVRPNPFNWVKAAQVPIQVIVGSLDTKPLKRGRTETHVSQAQRYVEMMRVLAFEQKKTPRVTLKIVNGVIHNLGKLSRASQSFMSTVIKKN